MLELEKLVLTKFDDLAGRPYRIRTCDTLIKSQRVYKKGQNPLDITFPNELHLYETLLGGESNVLRSNQSRLLNKEGGGHHEDTGGNR